MREPIWNEDENVWEMTFYLSDVTDKMREEDDEFWKMLFENKTEIIGFI